MTRASQPKGKPSKRSRAAAHSASRGVVSKASSAAQQRRQVASALIAEVRHSVDSVPPQKISRLVALVPRLRDRIRSSVAEFAEAAVERLEGEGLQPLQADREARERDAALSRARERGQATVAEILARPEMLSGEEFASRAGVSRETVNAWRAAGRVLGLEGNRRGVRYPAWQLDDNGQILAGLSSVLQELKDPWAAYRWLTRPLPEFNGETGLALVRAGRTKDLIEATRAFGTTF